MLVWIKGYNLNESAVNTLITKNHWKALHFFKQAISFCFLLLLFLDLKKIKMETLN